MHILLLGPYPPPQGGVQRNMLAIRDELRRAGHDCSVINITRNKSSLSEPDVYHPQTPLALVRLLLKLKYDLLHIHIGGEIPLRVLGLLLVCALTALGKSVLTLHSGGYPLSESGRSARKFSLRGLVFRLYQRIICVNRQQVEMFEKFGVAPEKIRLIYPFFNQNPKPEIFVPAPLKNFAEAHAPFLLTVGLIHPAYNLSLQIEALEQIRKKFPRAGLMILGAGEHQDELRRFVTAKKYAEHILFAGDVEHAVTLHLINECDALLRTTDYDGDAISIREALFLNTPVVATDNGMRPEGVHLVPKGDATALVKTIENVLFAAGSVKAKVVKPDDFRNIIEVVELYEEIGGDTLKQRQRQEKAKERILPSDFSSLWLLFLIKNLLLQVVERCAAV